MRLIFREYFAFALTAGPIGIASASLYSGVNMSSPGLVFAAASSVSAGLAMIVYEQRQNRLAREKSAAFRASFTRRLNQLDQIVLALGRHHQHSQPVSAQPNHPLQTGARQSADERIQSPFRRSVTPKPPLLDPASFAPEKIELSAQHAPSIDLFANVRAQVGQAQIGQTRLTAASAPQSHSAPVSASSIADQLRASDLRASPASRMGLIPTPPAQNDVGSPASSSQQVKSVSETVALPHAQPSTDIEEAGDKIGRQSLADLVGARDLMRRALSGGHLACSAPDGSVVEEEVSPRASTPIFAEWPEVQNPVRAMRDRLQRSRDDAAAARNPVDTSTDENSASPISPAEIADEQTKSVEGPVQFDTVTQKIYDLARGRGDARRSRFYLRASNGSALKEWLYMPIAEKRGTAAVLDQARLSHLVEEHAALRPADRALPVIIDISSSSLLATPEAEAFIANLTRSPDFAQSTILGLSQTAFMQLNSEQKEALVRLRACGTRFALRDLENLSVDPRALVLEGFRFVLFETPEALRKLGRDLNEIRDCITAFREVGIKSVVEHIDTHQDLDLLFELMVESGGGSNLSALLAQRENKSGNGDEARERKVIPFAASHFAQALPLGQPTSFERDANAFRKQLHERLSRPA